MEFTARALSKIRELDGAASRAGVAKVRPEAIRHVVVIIAASRSGSTSLHHALAHHPDLLSLQGENVAFEKCLGIGRVFGPNDSDRVALKDVDAGTRALLAELLCADAAPIQSARISAMRSAYDGAKRLLLQWPGIDIDPVHAFDLLHASLREGTELPWAWRHLLQALRAEGHSLEDGFYDGIQAPPVAEFAGPLIEEPPFVTPLAKAEAAIDSGTLLLKSSANCYRMPFLRSVFPGARFSWIYLARNPAASINGLVEGWLSPGFQSHDVESIHPLGIAGYASKRWWKFDLPPGWSAHTEDPLAAVCAFQWTSANREIMRARSELGGDRWIDARHEQPAIGEILDFLGLTPSAAVERAARKPVMTVTAPASFKWKKRVNEILPLLRSPETRGIAEALGYDLSRPEALA